RASRREWRAVDLGAMKRLEPVAVRTMERDQAANVPRVRKRLRLCGDGDARGVEPRRQRIERRAIGDLPAEEARAVAKRAVDHHALLAVVHAESEQRIAVLNR